LRPSKPQSDAVQTLQELVDAVSHDLGASARAIKGFADLLTRLIPIRERCGCFA
jgi:hypothetical protein